MKRKKVLAVEQVSSVPTVIGQAFGGGFYAGKISTTANGVATHYLIVSPRTTGQSSNPIVWGPFGDPTSALSTIDGPGNTAALAASGSAYPAATFCAGLNIGGYTDWYLPAQNELDVLYYFLKPDTQLNDVTTNARTDTPPTFKSGYNIHAVAPQPIATSFISATNPARTSAAEFIYIDSGTSVPSPGSGNEYISPRDIYWSSTEAGDPDPGWYVWCQNFADGLQQNRFIFEETIFARAVRRIPI